MKLTEQDINKLKKIGLITSTYPSKKIIEDLELDTVDLNKIFKYITHVDSTEKIEQWLSEEPGPTPPGPTPESEPLTFNIKSNGYINWICMVENGATIEYSKNDGDWISITATIPDQQTYKGTTIDVESGDVVKFRGDNPRYASIEDETPMVYGAFDFSTCEYDLSGNILSLINSTNYENITTLTYENTYAFMMLFESSPVVDASKLVLPATTLANSCYRQMFNICTSLTTAPELPATTLADSCYYDMFRGCTALTIAPKFSATTLADYCCVSMFEGCTSLTTAPELPATTLANYCYQNMFYGCTSLTTAPELPATTLTNYCYDNMFYGCISLNRITCLATDITATGCTSYWVKNVHADGIFIKNASMSTSSWGSGDSRIPTGWTVQSA